jgi:hypothetical protein
MKPVLVKCNSLEYEVYDLNPNFVWIPVNDWGPPCNLNLERHMYLMKYYNVIDIFNFDFAESKVPKCNCPISTLMTAGCQCEGI